MAVTHEQIETLVNQIREERADSIRTTLIYRLRSHIDECPDLTSLYLSGLNLNDIELAILAPAFGKHKKLKSLFLDSNSFSERGIGSLLEHLKQSNRLYHLSLADNKINNEGARLIAHWLIEQNSSYSSLRLLNLSSNHIAYTGAALLGSALKENTSLLSLNLKFNYFGKEGPDTIAGFLENNNTILSIIMEPPAGNNVHLLSLRKRFADNLNLIMHKINPIVQKLEALSDIEPRELKEIGKDKYLQTSESFISGFQHYLGKLIGICNFDKDFNPNNITLNVNHLEKKLQFFREQRELRLNSFSSRSSSSKSEDSREPNSSPPPSPPSSTSSSPPKSPPQLRNSSTFVVDFGIAADMLEFIKSDPPIQEAPYESLIPGSKPIGKGNYSEVFEGRYIQGPVAVKVVYPISTVDNLSQSRQDQLSNQALKELELLTRLRCKNVVSLLGISTVNQMLCIVMELIENGSLTHHINAKTINTCELLYNISYQIACGLAYLHAHKIIHRDIKPDNIMLRNDWSAVIVDLGLADEFSGKTGYMAGSGYWLAPCILEQYFSIDEANKLEAEFKKTIGSRTMTREEYDAEFRIYYKNNKAPLPYSDKSDIYSFALVLWSMYKNKWKPEFGRNINGLKELHNAVVRDKLRPPLPPPPKSEAEKNTVTEYCALITTCWDISRDKRPPASAVAKKLNKLYDTERNNNRLLRW